MPTVEEILTTPMTERRVLGWTFEQWALISAQTPGRYQPTPEGALDMRRDWLFRDAPIDHSKRDSVFALDLFKAWSMREAAGACYPLATALP